VLDAREEETISATVESRKEKRLLTSIDHGDDGYGEVDAAGKVEGEAEGGHDDVGEAGAPVTWREKRVIHKVVLKK
jgi:hypothetical protein